MDDTVTTGPLPASDSLFAYDDIIASDGVGAPAVAIKVLSDAPIADNTVLADDSADVS